MEGQHVLSAKKHSQTAKGVSTMANSSVPASTVRSRSAGNSTAKKTGGPGKGSKFEKEFNNDYLKGGQQQYKPYVPVVIPGSKTGQANQARNQAQTATFSNEQQPRGYQMPIVAADYETGDYSMPLMVDSNTDQYNYANDASSAPRPMIATDVSGQYEVPIIVDGRSSIEPRQMEAIPESYQAYGEDEMYLED